MNLRDAARGWLQTSGMLGTHGVPEEHLYFESTRAEKIARIIQLRCTHFIDDLEEVFNDPAFPDKCRTHALYRCRPRSDRPRIAPTRLSTKSQMPLSPIEIAERLCAQEVVAATICAGGANNRVYRIQTPGPAFLR